MSINKIQKFQDISLVQYFLNGAILGSEMPKNQPPGVPGWYIVGLTLIFTSPAAHTVTFVASAGTLYPSDVLQLADVKSQIQAIMTGVNVLSINGRLTLIETTPTAGVAISASGTANSKFGFDNANATTGKVLVPPGVTPAGGQG